jgi:DNA repair exonuclease SbcCD ATPase subunit
LIVFKTLRWKNLLSTGNTFTEVSLNTHNNTLIVGENGAGKSTILDALSFALFGKPFRKVNKGQLINSINNKGLLVECEFAVGNKNYLIKRGSKPTVFEIYMDGVLINADAASSDYQDILDKQILKINHKSFSQIVVLGSASFIPFMQLAAATRREVIEDLLDIQIFTTMNTLLKEKVAQNKNDIIDVSYKIQGVEEKIEMENSHLNEIQQSQEGVVKQKTEQIAFYTKMVSDANANTTHLLQEVADLNGLIDDHPKVQSRHDKVMHLARQINVRAALIEKDAEFFANNHDCPTCRQDISGDHKTTVVERASKQLAEIEEGKVKLTEEIDRLNQRLAEIASTMELITSKQQQINTNQVQANAWNTFITNLESELKTLTQSKEADTNKDRLKDLKTSLSTLNDTLRQLVEDRQILDVASVLLKDAGIKTKIIRQYIPVINKLINKYLAAMDFFVNFELNENFEETIKSRFRDEFSYASFSEGEKSRIDLALLFTWRSIAKLRNSASTNLLILDEVFDGSLDSQGNEELLKILQAITEGNNVFVISHKTDVYLDKFERVLKFEKQKNFSRMIQL